MKMKTKSCRLCLQYLLTRRVTVWSALAILLGTVVLVANICLVYNIRSGWALRSNHYEERSQQLPPSPTLWIYHKTVSLALVHLNIGAIILVPRPSPNFPSLTTSDGKLGGACE